MSEIDSTLAEREKTHGCFEEHATISQNLKDSLRVGCWDQLSDAQREALEMIVHKIARILNGNPNYKDSWHDIAGYSLLIEKQLEG